MFARTRILYFYGQEAPWIFVSIAKEFADDRETVKLLFVGSSNIAGQFVVKGGQEVIETFILLRKRFPYLELVIRSDVPKIIRLKYQGVENIKWIEQEIPREQLQQEFKSADIYICPAHHTPALVIPEAMSYELPVIALDVWAAERYDHGEVMAGTRGVVPTPTEVLHRPTTEELL